MFKWWWIALLVAVADQVSKHLALTHLQDGDIAVAPFLNFILAFNPGAAFGFLSDAGGWQNAFFVAIAIAVAIAIVFMLRQLKPGQTHIAVALMLVLGGAVGNVIDRFRFGHVVDFIDFYIGSWHWYTFNIADAAITIGAIVLALDAFGVRFGRRLPRAAD